MQIKEVPVNFTVWFSEDQDDATILVAFSAMGADGQLAFPVTKRFEPWSDWSEVAAWIWQRAMEAVKVVRL